MFRRKKHRLFRNNKIYADLSGKAAYTGNSKEKGNRKRKKQRKRKSKKKFFFVQLVNPHEKTSDLLR